jgi:hypothetical protein
VAVEGKPITTAEEWLNDRLPLILPLLGNLLYGDVPEPESPLKVGAALMKSDVGYNVREGGHSVGIFDWLRFVEFAEYHWKR